MVLEEIHKNTVKVSMHFCLQTTACARYRPRSLCDTSHDQNVRTRAPKMQYQVDGNLCDNVAVGGR